MSVSYREIAIASLSSLYACDKGPILFLDPELEALLRAGCIEERPAQVFVALRNLARRLEQLLTGAVARRAVL
ncbi:hypothetical protein [Paradevosia shaoguanensis]|uniref:Uncharacterized protein n=1 Tax=Paradevosia shaoguanensis TaxID=1335043 RepID=A0AA41UCH5_9HYPH|nr:hypothetical protein [Paradevosia shaoguanensis]MCF1744155.1 hypothetical protein [Paradevosia shaoguanensis]MCI0128638.1 hypothetical protein [Paradevosia shaoguanensis]